MLKNIKILSIFQLLVFIGNCHSMEELPAPQPINEFEFKINKLERENIELKDQINQLSKIEQENIELKKQVNKLYKIEQENIELKNHVKQLSKVEQKNIELINKNIELTNQVKQLSEQMQQLLTKENDIKQVNESYNNEYLALKSIYRHFNYKIFKILYLNDYKYNYYNTMYDKKGITNTYYDIIINKDYNKLEYVKQYENELNSYVNNVENTKKFLELCLPNVLDNDTKNKIQLIISKCSNALVKIDEYKNLLNLNTEIQEFKKQFRLNKGKLDTLGSEIDFKYKIAHKIWIYKITNSGIFKTIMDDIKNERTKLNCNCVCKCNHCINCKQFDK